MRAPALMTVALLVWTCGACVYTVQLWPARGVTDQGTLGLAVMLVGVGLLAGALVEVSPMLAMCVTTPGAFALAMLTVKVRSRVQTRWHTPPPARPAMLSRVPPPAADTDPRVVPMTRWWPYEVAAARTLDPVPSEVTAGAALDEGLAAKAAEAERAQRMARIFG
jgi:hypothetical protein